MQGLKTLWLPGTDHAGIATQNVVEKRLMAEGKTRQGDRHEKNLSNSFGIGKSNQGNTIIHQLKQLGASCDWDRLRFTMDEGLSQAVREVFVRLYEDGLIYREENGSSIGVLGAEQPFPISKWNMNHIKGKLYHIFYPVVDRSCQTRF